MTRKLYRYEKNEKKPKIEFMKNQIFALIRETKYQSCYLGGLVDKYQKRNRNIDIFLALASTSSIAAWAIWDWCPMFWAGIIALSQVLKAIQPFIPYAKYVSQMNEKYLQIGLLHIEIERLFFEFDRGIINENQANASYTDLHKRVITCVHFGDELVFDYDKKIQKQAIAEMEIYLKNYFN